MLLGGIVEQAIGEQMDAQPLLQPEPDTRKSSRYCPGNDGGRKDGPSRVKKLSSAKRKAIAKKGAIERALVSSFLPSLPTISAKAEVVVSGGPMRSVSYPPCPPLHPLSPTLLTYKRNCSKLHICDAKFMIVSPIMTG